MGTMERRSMSAKTAEPFTIRCAQPDDAANLLAYVRSVAHETGFFIIQPDEFPATEEQERQWIQEHLDNPGKLVLAAEVGGAIVGCLSFDGGNYRRTAHTGTFGISIRQDWRGRGIGTAMLEILLDWAAANPLIEKVELGVFSTNTRAIGLYRRLGFVEEGRRAKEIKIEPGRYVDEVLMGRFIKPGSPGSIEIP